VAGCRKSLEMQKVFLLEDLRYESHVLADFDASSVSGGYACTLLASMLECIESEKGNARNIFIRGINPKDAAGLVEALQTALFPEWLATPSPAGTRTRILYIWVGSGQTRYHRCVTRALLRCLALLVLLLAALSFACGNDEPAPPTEEPLPTATLDPAARPRSFQLGVSAQPVEPTEKGYEDAFALAGRMGELILIQRAPPWEDFLPGGTVSSRTERLTLIERRLAEENDLQLLLAIDPTEPSNRGVLAGIPPVYAAEGFASEELRSAFISYAKYLALNYHPTYLALGVEVDLIHLNRGDASFRNFVSLYFEAYDAVKEVSPDTKVFPTFQYENLLGILDDPARQPAWSLVARFQPKIDMLAVSSFPRAAFGSITDVPGDYYDALTGRFDLPAAFVSVGWASTVDGQPDESSQLAFLLRTVAAADRLQAPFLVWFLAKDPETPATNGAASLNTMGLLDPLGEEKNVFRVWSNQLSRPLR
jgi:hypothetical protein